MPSTQTLAQLVEARAKLHAKARKHALDAALAHYGIEEDTLRLLVFAQWLEEQAFIEEFAPMTVTPYLLELKR